MHRILNGLIGGWTLSEATLLQWREDKQGFAHGVLLVALVALVVGLAPLVDAIAKAVSPQPSEAARADVQSELEIFYRPLALFVSPETMEAIQVNTPAVVDLLVDLGEAPTPMPAPTSDLLMAMGGWLNLPLLLLGNWFGYTVWVLLIARWLGGTGGVRHVFSTTALASAPRVFYVLSQLAGYLLPGRFVAMGLHLVFWLWSVAVYVRAVQVAGELSLGRALVATVAPGLALILVIGCLMLPMMWLVLASTVGPAG